MTAKQLMQISGKMTFKNVILTLQRAWNTSFKIINNFMETIKTNY